MLIDYVLDYLVYDAVHAVRRLTNSNFLGHWHNLNSEKVLVDDVLKYLVHDSVHAAHQLTI